LATRFEYNTNALNNRTGWVRGAYCEGQTFTVGTVGDNQNHVITSAKFKLWRTGSPGTITCELKAADVNGLPVGDVLSTGTYNGNALTTNSNGEVIEIQMSSYELQAGGKYSIYIKATDGDSSNNVSSKFNYQGNPYTTGTWIRTNPTNWIIESSTSDYYFEIYGELRVAISADITCSASVSTHLALKTGVDINITGNAFNLCYIEAFARFNSEINGTGIISPLVGLILPFASTILNISNVQSNLKLLTAIAFETQSFGVVNTDIALMTYLAGNITGNSTLQGNLNLLLDIVTTIPGSSELEAQLKYLTFLSSQINSDSALFAEIEILGNLINCHSFGNSEVSSNLGLKHGVVTELNGSALLHANLNFNSIKRHHFRLLLLR